MSDLLNHPATYETSVDYQRGWAGGAIVSAILGLEKLLLVGVLDERDDDEWERRYELVKARTDVRLQIRSLRTALDVLDPRGDLPSRERLTEATP